LNRACPGGWEFYPPRQPWLDFVLSTDERMVVKEDSIEVAV